MICTVKNVIHVIECRGCNKYCIGETNNLRKRTTLYITNCFSSQLSVFVLLCKYWFEKLEKMFIIGWGRGSGWLERVGRDTVNITVVFLHLSNNDYM